MTDRRLTVSFGDGKPLPKNAQFARIVRVGRLTWHELATLLTQEPPVSEDKSSAGWYACAEFDSSNRHGDSFVARHCLTFDYDHITRPDVGRIQKAYADYAYALYTTASHTAEKPRLRMVLPLSRPAGYDEFQAVSRAIAARCDIELPSGESHVVCQMMYLPTVKPGQKFKGTVHAGAAVDVDAVLASYGDWTDRTQWPRRKTNDGVHATAEKQTPPHEKMGIVGDWCRAFDVPTAIERFGLPYERVR